MRTKVVAKPQEKKPINWALPSQEVTHDAFMGSIKEAEEGFFITVEEFEQRFEAWKIKKG